jgi:hypothetical protein
VIHLTLKNIYKINRKPNVRHILPRSFELLQFVNYNPRNKNKETHFMSKLLSFILVVFILVSGYLWLTLVSVNEQLNQTTSLLEITKGQLDNKNDELNTTKTILETLVNQSKNMERELQTAKIQLSSTRDQLEDIKSRYSLTQNQLTLAQNDKTQMLNQYASLREQIILRRGIRQDSQKYITPENANVSLTVKNVAGIYSEDNNEKWRDYEALYRWVVTNIKYSYDSYLPILPITLSGNLTWREGFWRMPEETLADKTGDCEDMANLLTSMILNYNRHQYSVWSIEIESNEVGHIAVAIPVVGNNLVILDPAGNYYTGKNEGYLLSLGVDSAIQDWLLYWKQVMPNAKVGYVFSDSFYKDFSNTQEFINWVKN